MSITIGIYDFFSYTIPGAIYLFVLFEVYKLLTGSYPPIDLGNVGHIILGAIASYLLGTTLNPLSRVFWYFPYRAKHVPAQEEYYERIKQRYPEVNIKFNKGQWPLILTHIRKENLGLANFIDRSKAVAVMLRSASLGVMLFAITQGIEFVASGYSIIYGATTIFSVLFSLAARHEGREFNRWYYQSIYEYAVAEKLPLSDLVERKKLAKRKKRGG